MEITSVTLLRNKYPLGKILLDHPLSYALTAITDVLVVYLLQFWKTVSKVPDTKDTIKFKLDTQEITYTVDMFRDTLHLPVETPDNPFIAPVNIKVIESFMQKVGYQGVVDKKKNVIQYPRFTKLIIADLLKKFPSIPHRLDEDYHSIKDDIPLIRATADYTEYETVFVKVAVLMNQPQPGKKRKQSSGETSSPRKSLKVTIKQKVKTTSIPPPSDDRERDEIAKATLLSLTLHKTTLATEAQENVAKVQEKLVEEEIEKMVEGEEAEESYASEFADSMLNDDVDDSDDDVEKTDDVAEEKDNDDYTDHPLVGTHATDKTISEELMATVSPTTATTSKVKSKRGFTFNKTTILPGSIVGMCRRSGQIRNHIKNKFVTHEFFMGKIREVLDHCNNVVPELMVAKTNEMIKEEMPRLHMQNTTLNLYPTTSSSTAEISTADLQHQLYLKMKSKPQDQAVDPELWETLKTKFEKPIEAHDPYSIVDKPDTGLIYLNSKNEKRVMYLVEIVKFCDATLEKVLKEVKLRIFQTELWKKPPLLGELDLDIMKAYKREITKRLRHREQIRRWESFVNGRPILPTMKRL
ncbi:hypothetical protein Tco_0761913 [Tanacetum coccineum]